MEKGNKVKIIRTGNIWEGKTGTILSENDGEFKVKVNFEVNGKTKNIIETFLEENLEMDKETEILNEHTEAEKTWEQYGYILDLEEADLSESELEALKDLERQANIEVIGILKSDNDKLNNRFLGNDNKTYMGSWDRSVNGWRWSELNLEDVDEMSENLNESLLKEEKEKKEDIIHPYVYLQDLDDKEIPAWNFLSRIATAENVDESVIYQCACDHGYKVFIVEAPSFIREVVAAKEIKAEDIESEYADFLQGKAVIHELEK